MDRRVAFGSAALVAVLAAGLVAAALTDSLWWHHPKSADASRVPGFGTVAFRVDGSSASSSGCALLANTTVQRGLGLMFRHDLAGYDGMVFLWPAPTTEAFYMKDTFIPLSIAWFDTSGRFVSETDMAPCPEGVTCPLFSAAAPYDIAIEVPKGGLGRLGIGAGSSLALAGGCH